MGDVDLSGTTDPYLLLSDSISLTFTTTGSPAYMRKLSALFERHHLDDPIDGFVINFSPD